MVVGALVLGRLAVGINRHAVEDMAATAPPDVGNAARRMGAELIEPHVVDVPEPTPLGVRRVIGDADGPFGHPFDLAFVGDSLVVLDWRPLGGDGQILILDSDTGEIVHSMGPLGQGPTDVKEPQSVQAVNGSTSRFWINDYRNGRMMLFDLASESKDALEIVRMTDSAFQAYWIDDSLLINGMFATELVRRYVRVGSEAKLRQEVGAPVVAGVDPRIVAEANRNSIALHPAGDRFALALFYGDNRLQVYDVSGVLLHDVHGPGGGVPDLAVTQPTYEWPFEFWGLQATEDMIFALAGDEPGNMTGTSEVRAYTWQGEPVAAWKLGTPVVRFALDPAGKVIWGLQWEPYPAVVEFEPLPDVLGSGRFQ